MDPAHGQISRYEWVTSVTLDRGGPIDDAITALAFGPDGSLAIGTPTCLNVRKPNGAIERVGGDEGLPVANITSLTFANAHLSQSASSVSDQLWIGTTSGVILYEHGADPEWRYLRGPRWLAADSGVVSMVALPADENREREETGGSERERERKGESDGVRKGRDRERPFAGDTVLVLGSQGVTWLTQEEWTLDEKAEFLDDILRSRHDR